MPAVTAPLALPPVHIDIRSQEPAYQQLAAWLRRGIEAGAWAPDEQVPSLHWFMAETGLASGTVRKGIRLLIDEGLLYTVKGRGTFVTRRPTGSG